MRRTSDWVMAIVGGLITLFVAFTCFSGKRLFDNIDRSQDRIENKVDVLDKKVDDAGNKLTKVIGQTELRLRRLEDRVDPEHSQPILGSGSMVKEKKVVEALRHGG